MMSPNAMLAVLLAGGAAAVQLRLPPLFERAMGQRTDLRLLEPSVDLVGGYSVKELEAFGHWPPWLVVDADRDRRSDVIAVVVRPGATRQFGVVAVHARDNSIKWIVPLGDRPINGVTAGPARDTVTPLYCIECDSNSWYRWNGRSYEAELYAVGERLVIASHERDVKLGLFAKAARDSKLLFTVQPCTQAVVRRVAGSEAERWYFVETTRAPRLRGWVPASFASEAECSG